MESLIKISNLNDFIFCPRSIYFHNLYFDIEEKIFSGYNQSAGKMAHKNIDEKKYSSKKSILQGINIFSEELGLIGKIDLFDLEKNELIERKNKISIIYDGYVFQIWAQYFCLIEMGYDVKELSFYSLKDNKKIHVKIPDKRSKEKIKNLIEEIKKFKLNNRFSQNLNKCKNCPYRNLCDYYDDDN